MKKMLDSDSSSVQEGPMKQDSNLHDITDFAIASAVCKDFPRLLAVFDKLLSVLQMHNQYMGVASVIVAVEDAQALMCLQLKEFQQVKSNRGKIE